jgi:hypothetical protein
MRPKLDRKGLPDHGAEWDKGTVLRFISRGPGIPVPVSNPHRSGANPVRVMADIRHTATIDHDGRQSNRAPSARTIHVIPDAPEGEEVAITVEF